MVAVNWIVYPYIIGLIASILCSLYAAIKRDYERLPVFIPCIFWFFIGYATSRNMLQDGWMICEHIC